MSNSLLVAGLGSGMVIAQNQDFVLARVPVQAQNSYSYGQGQSRFGS